MIDNFAPQPYPLECFDAETDAWVLVLGWTRLPDNRLAPVVAQPDDMHATLTDLRGVRYRLADTRPAMPRAAAPTVQPARREPRGG